MRTLYQFGHVVAALALAFACTNPEKSTRTETLSKILAEMVNTNRADLSPDSLAARRQELFEKHGTTEQELRAWIETARNDPAYTQTIAQQVTTLLDSSRVHPRPPAYSR